MIGRLRGLFGGKTPATAPPTGLPRLSFETQPARLYAIGDVHGHYGLLRRLEEMILSDMQDAGCPEAVLVMLGDYIDRGPASSDVLDWLSMSAPKGLTRYCLRGNHEAAFLEFLNAPSGQAPWLSWGGIETLASYGIYPDILQEMGKDPRRMAYLLETHIPAEHIAFLKALPVCADFPDLFCAHAGIRPGLALADQSDQDLMWIREPFLSWDDPFEKLILHGHTPAAQAQITPTRINLDSGAYDTGILSAVCICNTEPPKILKVA